MSITLCNGQPAVEVKDHELYLNNWRYIELSRDLDVATVNAIYESAVEDFWRLFAPEVTKEFGYGDVEAEGRSNGWLVVNKPPVLDPAELDDCEPAEAQSRASKNSARWEEFESRIDQLIVDNRAHFYEMLEEEVANRKAEATEVGRDGGERS